MLAKLEFSEATAHSHQVAELWLTGITTVIVAHQVSSSLHSSNEVLWERPEVKRDRKCYEN